jgi:hypothetical protein
MMGDLMGSAYEVRPVPVGRPARQWPIAVAAVTIAILALVVIKPWAWSSAPTVPPAIAVTEAGPVQSVAIAQPVTPAEAPTIGSLATHSGKWGVGIAGLGVDDDPAWVDWTAVDPEPAGDTPIRIAMWPGTGVCADVPVLHERPLFFAVTGPLDLPVDRRLVAWWSDGGRTASLDGSIRQVTAVGDLGVSYVVRLDRSTWQAGRYEFHVVAGDRRVSLTVCVVDSAS